MKLTTSTVLSAITWLATAGTIYGGEIPKRFQPYFMAASAIAGIVLHLYAGVHDRMGNKLSTVSETTSTTSPTTTTTQN